MKIVHCLNHYLPAQVAGTEVYAAALVRELKKHGNSCTIIIPNYNEEQDETYIFEGSRVIKYAEPSVPDRALITGLRPPDGLKNFVAVLKKEQPDIVHFHELAGSNGLSLYHVKAAKATGFKVLITLHVAKYTCKTGTLMYKNQNPCDGIIRKIQCSKCWLNDKGENGMKAAFITAGFLLLNKMNYDTRRWNNKIGTALAFPLIIEKIKLDIELLQKNTDAFVVLTHWYKNILLKNGVSLMHINLIEQALPSSKIIKHKNEIANTKLRVVFVGRINHFKGIHLLIEALKNISIEKIELDIYGKSTDEEYFGKCLFAANGMNNIRWMGSLAPEMVIETISNYDVFCLPSAVCEMAPLVIQEAFAAGTPVLASDVYGNAELITHNENGWLFKFKNANDLQLQLQQLINNPSLIEKARSYIKPVESFSTVAAKHITLYKQILSSL